MSEDKLDAIGEFLLYCVPATPLSAIPHVAGAKFDKAVAGIGWAVDRFVVVVVTGCYRFWYYFQEWYRVNIMCKYLFFRKRH